MAKKNESFRQRISLLFIKIALCGAIEQAAVNYYGTQDL